MNFLKGLTTIALFIAVPAHMMAGGNYEYNVTCEPDNCCPEPQNYHPEPCNFPYCQPSSCCSELQSCQPVCCNPSMCCQPPCYSECSWTPDCYGQPCCEPCFETPCYTSSRKSAVGFAVVGAILIAGAGAAIGYAAGHNNNKQCSQKPRANKSCCQAEEKCCCESDCCCCENDNCCCDNDICFLQDLKQELTFEINLALNGSQSVSDRCYCSACSSSSSNSIKITSFCVDPLGNMKTGKVQTIDFTQMNNGYTNALYNDQIHIYNPFYGTYNFGVQIEFCNNPPANSFSLTGQVNASKTQTTTTVPVAVSPNVSQADLIQYTGEFSYAPEAGVPSQ